MAFFDKASPVLKEILLKLYSAEKPLEIDHQIYEFGSLQYHIQASASEPHHAYLSVSTSLQSPGVLTTDGLQNCTLQNLKRIYSDVIEVIEPPNEGYQLTLRIKFSELPQSKDECIKIITEISSLQAVIVSSQLKKMLWNFGSQDTTYGMHKPIKFIYHPGEPFYVIRLAQKITVIFPMRFKENSDIIIATTLFQELTDVGRSRKFAKAPPCTWSPIPPPELRGEPLEDLSTNGGFVSFDFFSRHIEGKVSKLDKTVWNLLNFYSYVKQHVKSTRGFIQRRMRKKVEHLSEILQKATLTGGEHIQKTHKGHGFKKKLIRLSTSKMLRGKCAIFFNKIRSRIKIQGFERFRRKWLRVPKLYSLRRYTKLD
ncbi:Actin-related protein 2/3 complex subunit 2B [Thalictrum thalictroides]|uniref:Arp2/3 complex 34 kDa subunit n=1 Tax=Thalictrum thalictroides TaxID=46969 RepID=A0A7J6WZK7_THATH|nr:Actin-related protein 2/3 complex subunit 2B [Thalictrum thalictroides]